MPRTQVTGAEILDESIQKKDLDIITSGQAVITKIIAGNNIELQSTGADVGTGEVTIHASGGNGDTNLDGGFANSVYLATQIFDCGGA